MMTVSTISLTVTMRKEIINTALYTMETEELDNVTMNNGYDNGQYLNYMSWPKEHHLLRACVNKK